MMNLKIQCIALSFSFLYGIIFYFLVKMNKKMLFNKNLVIKVESNFLFMLDVSLCYFLILKFINNGVLHIYFLFMFLFGYGLIYFFLNKKK